MYYGHVSTTSNRQDWQEACVLVDEESGELIDISLCRVTMTLVKNVRNSNAYADGYLGTATLNPIVLTGSTDTGEITLPEMGTFEWLFPQSRMANLCQGEYQVGVRLSQDSRVVQLIIGTVNVDEGIDNQ